MSSSLDWIFSKDFLEDSASPRFQKCGIKESKMYQKKTIMFMEDLGAEMKCEKVVIATACVFFHRFYTFHSFKTQNRFNMAVACLFLASKTEEMLVKLRDIVIMYFRVRNPTHSPSESECKDMQKSVLLAERILLQTLGFDLTVAHPHNPLLLKLRELKNYIPEDKRKELYETAISFVTDSYRTTLCLQYPPNQVLYGAILLAAIQLSVHPVSSGNKITIEQSWFDILERERDIDELALKTICFQMMDLYDEQDNSLKCAIKDRASAMKNISQIVGGETSDTSKPSPTGVATEGEVGEATPTVGPTVTATPLKVLAAATSYENLYHNQEEEQRGRTKSVTVTSFLKPPTPQQSSAQPLSGSMPQPTFHHPRSNSLGSALPPPESPAPALDYSSDASTFSEANRELHTATPGGGIAAMGLHIAPPTPAVDSTPFTSYPCTPNFDSCPPPAAMREQDYRYIEAKTQFLASNSMDDNNNSSAPKRARIE